jgi:hypothetical protein
VAGRPTLNKKLQLAARQNLMNRRNFLSLFGAGVAGIALEQAIPFARVWSFPTEIVVPSFPPTGNTFPRMEWVTMELLEKLKSNLTISEMRPGDTFSIASVNQVNPTSRFS